MAENLIALIDPTYGAGLWNPQLEIAPPYITATASISVILLVALAVEFIWFAIKHH